MIVCCLFLNYLYLVTLSTLKVSLAFMCCYIIRDKLNTTLLSLLYAQRQHVAFNALLFMLLYSSYFSCYNIVAKFYCLELYLSCLCLKSTLIPAAMFHVLDQVVVAQCHIKDYCFAI